MRARRNLHKTKPKRFKKFRRAWHHLTHVAHVKIHKVHKILSVTAHGTYFTAAAIEGHGGFYTWISIVLFILLVLGVFIHEELA